ncbi:MAG: hypothetical protein QMB70_00385, partial [Aeromonadaceae bacterium]
SNKKGPYILTGQSCTPDSGNAASGATGTGGNTASGATDTGGGSSGTNDTAGFDSSGIIRRANGEIDHLQFSTNIDEKITSLQTSNHNDDAVTNRLLGDIASSVSSVNAIGSSLQSIETKMQSFNESVSSDFSHLSDDLDNIANSNRDSEIVSKLTTINNTVSSFMQGYAMVSQKEYQMLDSRLSALSSGSTSTPSVSGAVPTDLSGVIDSVKSVQSSIKDLDGDVKGFKDSISGDLLADRSLQENQIRRLDSLIDAVKAGSAGAGTGSGSGDGEGSGDVVGPAVPGEPGQGKSFWKTQYPGGLQTLFSNKMDEVKATALAGLLNNFQMTGLGNGSVSTVTFDFNFGPYANFGVYKFNDYLPDLSVIIRLLQFMVIFWALIGARSDIFGG